MSDDVKTYQIGDKEYSQTYLTIGQAKKLKRLAAGLDIEEMSAQSIVDLLFENDLIKSVFDVILYGPKPIPIDNMRIVDAVRIVEDFFSLNEVSETLSKVFSAMIQFGGMTDMITPVVPNQKSSTGTNSSLSPQMETSPSTMKSMIDEH